MPRTSVDILGHDDVNVRLSWKSGKEPIDNLELTSDLESIALVARNYGSTETSMIVDLDPGVDLEEALEIFRDHKYDVGLPVEI